MLTRKEMEQVLADGGSVLYRGRVITRREELPTEADLAAGNPEQEQIARAALDAQIAALQAERDRLGAAVAAQPASGEGADDSQTADDSKGEGKKGKGRAAE